MIHYFNPGHETAVLNASPNYTPPANMVVMQRDLAFLLAWYASSGDSVLVDNNIDPAFYNNLKENLNYNIKAITTSYLFRSKDREVALWGISPQVICFFERLNRNLDINLEIPSWQDCYIYLNSRMAARDCLNSLREAIYQIAADIVPRFCTSLDEIESYVQQSDVQLLAKAPYSSSGRGLLWLPQSGLTRTENQILHGMLKKQGSVAIERVLNKQVDFAMEFLADGKGNVCFEGYSLFETNNRGAYQGNFIGSQTTIENQLLIKIDKSLLDDVRCQLVAILSKEYGSVYKGCIGVDMMIYEENGINRVHPCLEINMRSNMGLLALRISQNYITLTSQGMFKVDFSAKEGELYSRHQLMMKQHPAIYAHKRLDKGYLALCPVTEQSHYSAYLVID